MMTKSLMYQEASTTIAPVVRCKGTINIRPVVYPSRKPMRLCLRRIVKGEAEVGYREPARWIYSIVDFSNPRVHVSLQYQKRPYVQVEELVKRKEEAIGDDHLRYAEKE